MELLHLFCLILFQVHTLCSLPLNADHEITSTQPENFERNLYLPSHLVSDARSRKPKRLIRKIHSGIAFLAGVKLGSLLANKGFEAGHGSLAATNSFQIFGKSINSAISLSYGGIGQKLPLLDDPGLNDTGSGQQTKTTKEKEDILHLTLVHNPSQDTIDELKRIAMVSVAGTNQTLNTLVGDDLVIIESTAENVPETGPDQTKTFIQAHNKRVNDFNNEIRRRNSKY